MLEKVKNSSFPAFRPFFTDEDEEMLDLIDLAKMCWEEIPQFRPRFSATVQVLKNANRGRKANMVNQMLEILQQHSEHLETVVAERTAALAEERQVTEKLLYKLLPSYVVKELKAGHVVEPESFDSVTIYFSDIVEFTKLAAASTPMEIVDMLNSLYSEFDNIIDDYDVYKVETIGDAYMVCSGVPVRNGIRHASEIATMALHVMSCVAAYEIPHRPERQLQMRCGMHTGSVVAGVVGLKMPRYCLFGESVNIAQSMENTGSAQRIQVSEASKVCLDKTGGFHLVERGLVEIKASFVKVKTYYLYGKDDFDKILPVNT